MPRDQTSKLIAIIDDNEAMRDSLCDLIESGGFEARCFGSAKAFLESDLYGRAGCLIVDIRIPKMSGLELQARLKQERWNVPIIFLTAFCDAELRAEAMNAGAVEFLAKPFDHQQLLKLLRSTLDRQTHRAGSPHFAISQCSARAS
jgi:FixJ family two-component response regulator